MLNLTLTIALTLLTLMVTVSGNPNPTNPTTKYRCESVNLNCKITTRCRYKCGYPGVCRGSTKNSGGAQQEAKQQQIKTVRAFSQLFGVR